MEMMPAYLGTSLTAWVSTWNNSEIGTLSPLGIREDLHNVQKAKKKNKDLETDRHEVDPSFAT